MTSSIGTCAGCGAKFKIPDTFTGTRGKCKKCGGVVEIPPIEEQAAEELKPEAKAPANIIPSMPMLTTPERSLYRPLIAANAIGVALTKLLTSIPVRLIDLSREAQTRKARIPIPTTNATTRLTRSKPLNNCQTVAKTTTPPST